MASTIPSAVSQTKEAAKPEDPAAARARAEFLRQLNLQGVSARAAELQKNLDIIITALQHQPDKVTWTDVVSKYSVVSLQYQQMMGQLRPILKHNAVFPKAVNEHNAARLPLLLSTKLLPDMDAAAAQMLQAHQAASKDKELAVQVSELTDQGEHLNDVVRSLTEANPADPASGPLDPSGLKYRRLVQELQASTAPAPTRQLPSQAGAGRGAGDGSRLVAAVLTGRGLKPGPMQRQSG